MKRPITEWQKAQTALEFVLLLAIVAAITLVGFKAFLPKSRGASEKYFNIVGNAITGPSPSTFKTR